MTTALIWILTPVLILDCLLLGLLVLIQLPKKEAGVGMAFGGGATDALFGAGSGTALTKLTKYTAGIFFGLVLILSLLNINAHNSSVSELKNQMGKVPAATPPPSLEAASAATNAPAGSNAPVIKLTVPASNSPSVPPK